MSKPSPRPPRELVRRTIGEEAVAANISTDAVIDLRRGLGAAVARKAMRRIIRETGCTPSALADVWGCETSTVTTALSAPELVAGPAQVTAPHCYGAGTIERLKWAHGDAQTAQIVAGNDPRTQADIARWNALGRSGGQAA